MAAVVSKRGLSPDDEFVCSACGSVVYGQEILDGDTAVYFAKRDASNPNNNQYRCAECEEDRWLAR
jgi:DNA-directed RNA polymerase subunit RPC12/RpoP